MSNPHDDAELREKIANMPIAGRQLRSNSKHEYLTSEDVNKIMQLIHAREREILEDAALEVVKKESEMALHVYRSIKHRLAMGQGIDDFMKEREAWHIYRLKSLTNPNQQTGEK